MKKIKFSIIVPVYNMKEAFLRASLNSLLNIDYDNYEIIIVDDGSNQETNDILNEYSNNHLIKIIHQENSGQHVARNNGIVNSTGEYIVFVDSDDQYDRNNFNVLNEILNNKEYDVVLHDNVRFDDTRSNIFNGKFFEQEGELDKKEVVERLVKLQIGSICCKCIKKEILTSIDFEVDKKIRKGEDLVQTTKVLLQANSFYYTDRVIYNYRINEEARDYYKLDVSDDLNYLVSMYDNLFKSNSEYSDYLPLFKKHAINDIIYNVFCALNSKVKNEDKKNAVNNISRHRIISIIDSINCNAMVLSDFVFNMIRSNNYIILKILAFVYELFI